MEKHIQIAEEIADAINMQLVKNEPEFRKLFDAYNEAYCKLRGTIETKGEEETINELCLTVKKHLNHQMLREMFVSIHPNGRHAFFYFNNDFLMTDSRIKILEKEIKAFLPNKMHGACFEFINCYKKLMKFYEKEISVYTKRFTNECYEYYC